ncbi:methylamine utilization protein MauE [Embleya scabrispora]|uniref:Methylamine utilization protein MauE n=1 Tax=Embleya scabrispora TaxID=159449 RepID=A0A1T3NPZ3_9ACTN|nr:MauE/DoxX family redox-associated membrane protein [Embleya scabrispora]OPC78973.1 methylamine utilization protein MauE [Embleya scabrispora]
MGYAYVGCACLVGLVFVASAVSKFRDFAGFVASVPHLVPMPIERARPIAILVVAAETAVPVLVAVPPLGALGFTVAAVLLLAFTVAVAGALRLGRRSSCRCFGASDAPLGARHLARNGVLLAAACAGAAAAVPGGATDSPPLAGGVVAGAAGLVGALLIITLDDIVDLFARTA